MATNKCGTNVEGHNGGLGAVPLVGSRGKAPGQWSGEQSHKFLFTYQTLHLNTLKSSKNQRKTKATFVPKLTHFGRDAVGRILAFHRPHVGRVLCTLYASEVTTIWRYTNVYIIIIIIIVFPTVAGMCYCHSVITV